MLSQADEAKPQQVILGLEMGIECSAADIGLINDVLDRQPVITPFGDERGEGRIESLPGLSDTAIHRLRTLPCHPFRSEHRWMDTVPDSEHLFRNG